MGKYGWKNNQILPKKIIVQGKVPMQYVIASCAAEGTAGVLSAFDFNAIGTTLQDHTKIAAQPPYAMRLVVSAMVAGTAAHSDKLAIAGYDAMGNSITESVYLKATALGSTATDNAFAKITSIKANQTVKSTKVAIGWRKIIGLPWPIESADDILTYQYMGAYATTAYNALTINATYNTLTLPTMGAKGKIAITYLTKLQN